MAKITLSKLIERQDLILKEIEFDFNEFKHADEARKSKGYVKACITDSEECFKRAKKDHEFIVNSASDPSKDAYFEADTFAKIKRVYFSLSGMLNDEFDKFNKETNTNLDVSRFNSSKISLCDIRLPPIQIKKFSGSLTEWSEFHNLFESMVDQNNELCDTQKLQFLKTHVTDNAALLIQHLSVDADGKNYAAAWKILNERYQNKRKLVNNQLRVLMEQENLVHESAETLKSLHDTSANCILALSNLGIGVETWDAILIYVVYQKLPLQTQKDWEEKLGSSKSLPEWKSFSAFIEGRFSSLENIMDFNQGATTSNASNLKTFTQITNPKTPNEVKKFLCRLCKASHGIRQCQKFLKMDMKTRSEVVKANSVCSNCLGYDHHASICKSGNCCQKCGQKHHTLLHFESQNNFRANNQQYFPHNSVQRQNHTAYNTHFVQGDNNQFIPANRLNNRQDYAANFNQIQNPNRFAPANVYNNGHNGATTSNVPLNSSQSQNHNPFTASNPEINVQDSSFNSNQSYYQHGYNNGQYNAQPSSTYNTFHNHMHNNVLLATALVKVLAANGTQHVARALIDPGSEASFLTENIAQLLNLKKKRALANVKGLGQTSTGTSSSMVNITLFSCTNFSFSLDVSAFVFSQLTSVLPARQLCTTSWEHLSNLPLADPSYFKPGKIDILLGADVYPAIILEGLITGQNGSPVAQKTELGWILTGGTTNKPQMIKTTIQSHHTTLDFELRKFWEIEEDLVTRKLTSEEDKCQLHYEKTTRRREDGRYEVQLPFKENVRPNLGNSKGAAMARYFQIERRLKSNEKLKQAYTSCLNEYSTLGHMKEVETYAELKDGYHYFLPHHAVFNESSSTTKLRVVFDASCKTSKGISLNDYLMIGPRLQMDIIDLIAQWRKFKVAFAADISMMYRQIWMSEEDTPYQLILWREKNDEPIRIYALKTVTFGTASAPYLAVRTLQQLAMDTEGSKPHVTKAIMEGFYVDDFIYGADDEEDAIKLQTDVISTLSSAGLPLRKWASNSTKILEGVPEKEREVNLPLTFETKDAIKMLGIQWNPAKDTFSFKINIPETNKHTKRSVLADIARLFDPLGWISPCVMKAKLILQQLWVKAVTWDGKIPSEIENSWSELRGELHKLEKVEIPRWLSVNQSSQVQLHGFSDASEKAYAAVIYTRVISNGEEKIQLLASKTRVAPVKNISLPRLELCAALLLAKLLHKISIAMQFQQVEMFAWCDSMITLAWIKGSPSIRTTFVANRITEIQGLTSESIWRHVSGKENPADIGSRGLSPEELISSQLWWCGPQFLKGFTHCNLPTLNSVETEEETKKEARKCFLNQINNDFFKEVSTLKRLVQCTAIWRRYIYNKYLQTNGRQPLNTHPLTVDELMSSHYQLIRVVQRELFTNEIEMLKKNNSIPKGSQIRNLNPFLDEINILRVGGRLGNSSLPFHQRHPIILNETHHFSRLLADDIHKRTLHGGQQMMMAEIRNEYWITNLKRLVKSIIHKCVRCHRYNAVMQEQLMGNLPEQRVTISRPFSNTGVDYAGPVEIKAWKGKCNKMYKGYIAVFICLATKAIHIELVSDLTAAAFIAAFRRFVARRGFCNNIFSDCGTNFKGANNELRKDNKFITSEWSAEVAKTLASYQTTWHFNPPSSPHFGGLWEAGVKSIKYHLKRVIGLSKLTFEEYATLLTQIEACLNSRPLCPMTSDPNDLTVLTPAHFLIGAPLHTLPERSLMETNINNLDRWRYIQRLTQEFWKQWRTSYLHLLQQRPKWLGQKTNINIGDIVLIKEDNLPPSEWLLGLVVELHPGSDDLIRVVTIKTKNSILKRPIVKISPLPISN